MKKLKFGNRSVFNLCGQTKNCTFLKAQYFFGAMSVIMTLKIVHYFFSEKNSKKMKSLCKEVFSHFDMPSCGKALLFSNLERPYKM